MGIFFEYVCKYPDFFRSFRIFQSQEKHTSMRHPGIINKLSEILIQGNDNPLFFYRHRQDVHILHFRIHLSHRKEICTCFLQVILNENTHTDIDDKPREAFPLYHPSL